MKLFLKIVFLFILSLNLKADVFSVFLENDVVDGKDRHYTNGTSFMYLSNNDTNDTSKDNSFLNLISKISLQTVSKLYEIFLNSVKNKNRSSKFFLAFS